MVVESQTDELIQYDQLQEVVQAFRKQICETVLDPIVRRHFKNERGNKLRATLPDRASDYRFSSHGFEALVLPNKRKITNYVYDGVPLTETQIIANTDKLENIFDDAVELWNDTFGDVDTHKHTASHPGEFPIKRQVCEQLVEEVNTRREQVLNNPSLDTIIKLLREQNTPLLSRVFQISKEDIYTPGASDISLIQGVNQFNLAYSDDDIALLNPVRSSRRRFSTPTRGLVVGFDDTPVGVFGHVVDTTNLNSDQTVTRQHIKQAMGFDDELDPYNPRERLDVPDGTRVRIQGDLRVEYSGGVENYSEEYANRVRREEYRTLLNDFLSNATITNSYLSQGSLQASDVVNYTVSHTGNVVVESQLSDTQATLVAFGELLIQSSFAPVQEYTEFVDIPYLRKPGMRNQVIHTVDENKSLAKAINDVQELLEFYLQGHSDAVEETAHQAEIEAETALSTGKQANLPVDNHFAMISNGFVPDIETEPVLTLVDEESTLHVGHAEHNTVSMTIVPGIYEFSVLPRGLQPPSQRPDWS